MRSPRPSVVTMLAGVMVLLGLGLVIAGQTSWLDDALPRQSLPTPTSVPTPSPTPAPTPTPTPTPQPSDDCDGFFDCAVETGGNIVGGAVDKGGDAVGAVGDGLSTLRDWIVGGGKAVGGFFHQSSGEMWDDIVSGFWWLIHGGRRIGQSVRNGLEHGIDVVTRRVTSMVCPFGEWCHPVDKIKDLLRSIGRVLVILGVAVFAITTGVFGNVVRLLVRGIRVIVWKVFRIRLPEFRPRRSVYGADPERRHPERPET